MFASPIKTLACAARYCLAALVAGVTAVSAQGQAVTSSQGFDIFRDGKPTAAIILPEAYVKPLPEHRNELLPADTIPAGVSTEIAQAVREFQSDLQQGYNIKLPLGEDSSLPNRIELDVKNTTLLEEDNASVTFPEPNIMRITGGQSGIMRTLFYILEEDAGVRYLFQDASGLGTHYPPLDTLTIPRKPFTHTSAFPLGRRSDQTIYGMAWPVKNNRRHYWAWEMRLGAKARIADAHTLTAVVFPMEKYIRKEQAPPDAIFPIHNGKLVKPQTWPVDLDKPYFSRGYRKGWQPRYSQQATVDEAVKNILAYLKEHPQTRSISLSVNDRRGFSDDEKDKESEAYFGWVNQVAAHVTQQYPQMLFGTYAYSMVMNPPSFKLNPNVIVYITFDWQGVLDDQVRNERTELVTAWSKLATIAPYSYNHGDDFYSLPRIYTKQMVDMIRLFHDSGALSSISERAYFTLPEGPKIYLYFKLLENPDLDVDKTIMDWCTAAVGKEAAPYLRDYYAFWETFWKTKAVNTSWWHSGLRAVYFSLSQFGSYMYAIEPGDMEHCGALMEKVVELAQSKGLPDQALRAKLIMSTFEWYQANAVAAGAEFFSADGSVVDKENTLKLLQNIPNAQKAYEISCTLPAKLPDWIASGLAVADVKRNNPIPASLAAVSKFIADPQVIQELGKLAKNKALNEELRFMAHMLHATATGEKVENMATNGGFEEATQTWDVMDPVYGSVSVSTDVAFKGEHSLKFNIQWPSGRLHQIISGAKPDTQYFFSAMVYVPDSQPVEERRISLRGSALVRHGPKFSNLNHTQNIPVVTLIPGKWNYVSCIIPAATTTEAIAMRIYLNDYKSGEVVYIDDVQLVPIQ